ncbi:hypothetical protein M9H77_36039 [Catharanthus roseus]|uniref:Uncharacterized protein n=1 Tax=Catharanthus roseus TaxID=4058 RepID=A0ACB9ZRN5_CATRO|nr:hypothetical protein M9H77_36039 [Catharanthus roseus]
MGLGLENDYEMLLALDENNHQHSGATDSQINGLPQSTVQNVNVVEDCAICLETPTTGDIIRHLPCLHKFHKDIPFSVAREEAVDRYTQNIVLDPKRRESQGLLQLGTVNKASMEMETTLWTGLDWDRIFRPLFSSRILVRNNAIILRN